jgi:NAD(P)-dependent dehydrogenase (short-subunit alcohol dehydrogenase family)
VTRTILITGCSSGFGEASAKLFASRGWNVVATMRNPDFGWSLGETNNIHITHLDVQDRASIDRAIAEAINRFGRIDAVLNNAGYGLFGIFESTSREAVQQQFDVNVFGAMDVTRAILPHFRSNRNGTIINIGSGARVFASPMASIYSAARFALEGFSESLAYELAGLGIRVKIVESGVRPETVFTSRARMENGGPPLPQDYNAFMKHTTKAYCGIAANTDPDTVRKIVEAIFSAATDGKDQLRYAPNGDIPQTSTARRAAAGE